MLILQSLSRVDNTNCPSYGMLGREGSIGTGSISPSKMSFKLLLVFAGTIPIIIYLSVYLCMTALYKMTRLCFNIS